MHPHMRQPFERSDGMKYEQLEIALVECKETDVISTSEEVTTKPIWPWGQPSTYTDMDEFDKGSYNTK